MQKILTDTSSSEFYRGRDYMLIARQVTLLVPSSRRGTRLDRRLQSGFRSLHSDLRFVDPLWTYRPPGSSEGN
jgi:hypothetical protein